MKKRILKSTKCGIQTVCMFDLNGNNYRLCIYGNDRGRKIPHFHILENGETIACIEINNPYYYDHGFNRKEKTLSNELLVKIDTELRLPTKILLNGEITYKDMCGCWNSSNDTTLVIETRNQPNYTLTKWK